MGAPLSPITSGSCQSAFLQASSNDEPCTEKKPKSRITKEAIDDLIRISNAAWGRPERPHPYSAGQQVACRTLSRTTSFHEKQRRFTDHTLIPVDILKKTIREAQKKWVKEEFKK